MLTALWGRITGKDKRRTYPNQQAEFLGRVGDYTVVYPYGLYCDLPDDVLVREVSPGMAVPLTVSRPDDAAQGEPTFFHPETNTRIVARNNGDLDIYTDQAGGNVNITTVNATLTASGSVTVDSPSSTFTGNVQVDGALNVDGDITGLTNIIAAALVQGATLTISGAGSIAGKDFATHIHGQGVDSNGDSQANTTGVL